MLFTHALFPYDSFVNSKSVNQMSKKESASDHAKTASFHTYRPTTAARRLSARRVKDAIERSNRQRREARAFSTFMEALMATTDCRSRRTK
ncbi:MAG: hypothetical protein P4L92_07635 [Rudaea sp.]|nr:hypothetical protein [Rudaea sp.]